jgi:hypothetical protein
LLKRGVAPNWELMASELAFPFVAVAQDDPGAGPRIAFVSRRALSIAAVKLVSRGQIAPVHHRLAASVDRVEAAEATIDKLSDLAGCRLRLPTPRELRLAWNTRGTKRTPQGRPLVLADFERNLLGIDVPPAGTAEWARAPDRSTFRVKWGKDALQETLVETCLDGSEESYFRIAFDVEDA